jgi:uncharacterized protein with von Willebrand factor type A (vWA) domain
MIADRLADFAERLRTAGVAVETSRLGTAAEALIMAPWLAQPSPYWPLRLTLCSRPDDVAKFDAVYSGWYPATTDTEIGGTIVAVPDPAVTAEGRDPLAPADGTGGAGYAADLAGRDLRTLDETEKALVADLIVKLVPTARPLHAPRWRAARSGRVDVTGTIRHMMHSGGEPTRLSRRRRDRRPGRVLFLIDVSRSMRAEYVDAFLLFAHAAVRAAPGTTEVFTIGTRWTRVTAELSARDPQEAMGTLAAVETDWAQGTQLGRSLESFLRRWSGHRAVRSAVVVICSDGLEEGGDQELLPRQIARLSRIARRIIWVNPGRRRPGYRPMLAGLRDSLDYAEEQLSGHTLDELQSLVAVIAR